MIWIKLKMVPNIPSTSETQSFTKKGVEDGDTSVM